MCLLLCHMVKRRHHGFDFGRKFDFIISTATCWEGQTKYLASSTFPEGMKEAVVLCCVLLCFVLNITIGKK
eukprot:m.71720 g.71720  ORF g.71720 m.71720 type:complete len:71 (+) comp8361_c1_seq5:2220-2432(+)